MERRIGDDAFVVAPDPPPYPDGPMGEADAIAAAKEVDCNGFITGGPHTPAEWRHWNAARAAGWEGRYPLIALGLLEET